MKLTRRKLIFGAAGATALLPLSYAVRVSIGGYEYPQSNSHLTAKEATIVAALAEAVIGAENVFGISPESVDTVGAVNNFIATNSKLEQGEMRILFWAIEHIFPALGGHFAKFSELSTEQRRAILKKLEHSRSEVPKLLARASKTIIAFGYFNTPQVQEYLGLRGWCGP
jgi:hypothetical protein